MAVMKQAILLEGKIVLPIPGRSKGFTRPDKMNGARWSKEKPEVWRRAYLHCLYSLPLHFELPLHSVVPRLAKKMMEATDPFNVALRFMGEMELEGYVTFERGYDERIVMPTKKFLDLRLDLADAPESAIRYPKVTGEDIERSPIRGGVSSDANRTVAAITSDMASEKFEVNKWVLNLIKEFPPEFDEIGPRYMFQRTMHSAEKMLETIFRFPYFLDSRSRMYDDTTCGFSPQGADHEKAVIIPTYKEVLTDDGFAALIETAHGYSEIEWTAKEIASFARNPKATQATWSKSDKPYSFMACADLIRRYLDNPLEQLPAFIPLDGRCSGLQHWSAVVRSNAITRHLGMHEEEHALDIYEKVAKDWAETLPFEKKKFATRKAAKIPVMTWGYNATMMTSMDHMHTMFGAKKKWCEDTCQYEIVGTGLEKKETAGMGKDLYEQLNKTLGPLQAAVSWVSDCATTISSDGNVEIHWPTPDGFEAMQRKVKGKKLDIAVKLSDGNLLELDLLDFSQNKPNTAKHKSAIAPNVIHSLDATHLRMVARRLRELGLPMIFIHDSFATHCNHRKVLYDIIVEEFIMLYSREYLVDLKVYWEDKYGVDLPWPPMLGDWAPESLRHLKRFFL